MCSRFFSFARCTIYVTRALIDGMKFGPGPPSDRVRGPASRYVPNAFDVQPRGHFLPDVFWLRAGPPHNSSLLVLIVSLTSFDVLRLATYFKFQQKFGKTLTFHRSFFQLQGSLPQKIELLHSSVSFLGISN
jgi:hypothetical protein